MSEPYEPPTVEQVDTADDPAVAIAIEQSDG